jgi:hypothetical protein
MYQDLKQKYWWYGMKKDVAAHVALCDVCQRVKAEHQRPTGLLQPLQVPEWKWEEIGMDFIVGLPRTRDGYDSIWVIVDRLTKVTHFIPVKTTYSGTKLAELYISKMKDQMATREGGVNRSRIKILLKEPGLYPSPNPVTHKRWNESHTNCQNTESLKHTRKHE